MPAVLIGVDIGALVVALLLLAFIAANYPTIYRAVLALLQGLPLIGGWIAANVASLVARMLAAMSGWVDLGLQPLTALVEGLTGTAYNLAHNLTVFAMESTSAIARTVQVVIPAALAQAVSYTDARVGWLAGQLAAEADALRAEILADFKLSTAYTGQLFALATAYARGLYLEALTYTDRSVAAAEALLSRQIAIVLAEALAGVAEAEALTRLRFGQAEAYTASQFARAVGIAQGLFRDARTYSDQQTRAAEAQATAQNAALASAVAASIATVAAAVTAIEDSPCMQQCDVLGDLGQAVGLIDLAALVALVYEAAHDPAGTVEFIRSEVAPVATEAAQLAGDVVGVRV